MILFRKKQETIEKIRYCNAMQTSFHLTGKTILITGASSGIGKQVAIDCAKMGGTVIITGRNELRLNETYQQLPGTSHQITVCDLLDENAILLLSKNCPHLDGVVHCAGMVRPFPVQFLNSRKIDETLHTNFYTAACLTSALFKAKKINSEASLVFLSSISGQFPGKGNAVYAASKAALEAFAKTVAAEYSHKMIRANCLSPAMVKTELYDYTSEGEFKAIMDKHVSQYPLGVGYPHDVANAVVFLLSPASRWITGINIIMDGGFIYSH
jgi:NAD(P)-dependent dehydrogenase (short-subunit alcohol dehydrogenase family)